MRTRALLAFAIIGCASTTEPTSETSSTSGDPTVQVDLPSALGGGADTSQLAVSTPPAIRHHVGAPLSTANPVAESTEALTRTSSVAPPASIDLSNSAPPVGDQGDTDSCQAWATGYVALGWWANRVGVTNAQFAPMYLYAQYARGNPSIEAWPETPLAMLASQGIETFADYEPMEANLDCTTQPSYAQKINASHFKISGYLKNSFASGVQDAIESTLAAGYPITLTIAVYPELENANPTHYVIGPPRSGETTYGGHVLTAFSYDRNGVWIENQWGTSWGRNGWAELSWAFVAGSFNGQPNVADLDTITGVSFGR